MARKKIATQDDWYEVKRQTDLIREQMTKLSNFVMQHYPVRYGDRITAMDRNLLALVYSLEDLTQLTPSYPHNRPVWGKCRLCGFHYNLNSEMFPQWKDGAVCGDLSHGGKEPCPGIIRVEHVK